MPGRTEPFRIAIVGGGIGGLFATLSLQQHCKDQNIAIDVYEKSIEYGTVGTAIGVGVNATKLIAQVGLLQELYSIAGDMNGIMASFRRFDNGDEIITVPIPEIKGLKAVRVLRAGFLDMLLDAIKTRNAGTLHTSKKLQRLQEDGDRMTLQFEDGTTASADFVIGADGVHSKIRSQAMHIDAHYGGLVVYRGLIDMNLVKDWWPLKGYSACWLGGKQRHFVTMPVTPGNTILKFGAFVDKPETLDQDPNESWRAMGSRAEMLDDFKDFDETVRKLIQISPQEPGIWKVNDFQPVDNWVLNGGKVVLLGDSAHAIMPHEGAGAGQAMEDGWVLGRTISDYLSAASTSPSTTSLLDYATLYQNVRLPRAQRSQLGARATGAIYACKTDELKDLPIEKRSHGIKMALIGRAKYLFETNVDEEYDVAKAKMAVPDVVEEEGKGEGKVEGEFVVDTPVFA